MDFSKYIGVTKNKLKPQIYRCIHSGVDSETKAQKNKGVFNTFRWGASALSPHSPNWSLHSWPQKWHWCCSCSTRLAVGPKQCCWGRLWCKRSWYCWCKKSCTSWSGKYSVVYFLPSTVLKDSCWAAGHPSEKICQIGSSLLHHQKPGGIYVLEVGWGGGKPRLWGDKKHRKAKPRHPGEYLLRWTVFDIGMFLGVFGHTVHLRRWDCLDV